MQFIRTVIDYAVPIKMSVFCTFFKSTRLIYQKMEENCEQAIDSYQLPEKVFLSRILEMKKSLQEDNYTNIRNISQSNHNFNEIFCYLKGVIRKLQINYDKIAQRNHELQRELRRVDPQNLALLNFIDQEKDLGQIGGKLDRFVPLKSKCADSFDVKMSNLTAERKPPIILSKKVNREHMRSQIRTIQEFIRDLCKNMIQDREKKFNFPKQMLVNLYIRWNSSKHRTPLVNQSLIKSQLTNELKKVFPKIDHNERFYRGVMFRLQHQKQISRNSQSNSNYKTGMEEEEVYWQLQRVSEENLQLDDAFEMV